MVTRLGAETEDHVFFLCFVPNMAMRVAILGISVAIYGRQDRTIPHHGITVTVE